MATLHVRKGNLRTSVIHTKRFEEGTPILLQKESFTNIRNVGGFGDAFFRWYAKRVVPPKKREHERFSNFMCLWHLRFKKEAKIRY